MIGMYVQSILRLNLIVLFLLLIRRLIGSRLRKKFIYGLWIVVPVFLLSFPFIKLPQLFHLDLHWNPHFGQLLLMKENNGLPDEKVNTVAIQQEKTDDPGITATRMESRDGIIGNEHSGYENVETEITGYKNARNKNTENELSYLEQKENAQVDFETTQTQTELTGDVQNYSKKINILAIAVALYLSIVVGIMFTIFTANLLFMNSCKKKRKYLFQSGVAGLPVYHMDGISSPFLMGKTIYLPSFMTEEEQIRYAVLHEESHYRHGDAFWVIMRYAIVAIYFYDPIIWWAFFASGYDCELACDEEVLERLGAEECKAYGACLLEIVEQNQSKNNRMVLTTNMSTGKKFMKKRILSIMDRKKKSRLTMALAAALLLLVTGCVYEKQSKDAANQEDPTSQAEEVKESTNETAKIEAVEDSKEGEKEEILPGSKQAEDGKEVVTASVSNVNQNTITDAENSSEEKEEQKSSYRYDPYTIEASEITTEDLIYVAYRLGEFESISEISPENMVMTLVDVVDRKVSWDPELAAMFGDGSHPYFDGYYYNDYEEGWYEVYEYDVEQVKKAAKDILDVDLTEYLENIKTVQIEDWPPLKCKDGKLYEYHIVGGGEDNTIKNISKDGDTYTFYECGSRLDSWFYDLIYYKKYETVIQNGVIKSVKYCGRHTDEEIKAYEEEKNREAIEVDTKDRDRLNIAYLLMEQHGDFNSVSSISKETILPLLIRANLHVDKSKAVGAMFYNEYKENEERYYFECTEEKVRQAAKEYLNLDLTQRLENDPKIKYRDGKYVMGFHGMNEWGMPLCNGTIFDIRKNGDVYTFRTRSESSYSEHYFMSEEHQYEVVIKDGVIVSGKQIY